MLIDPQTLHPAVLARRTMALALFTCASTLGLSAQEAGSAASPASALTAVQLTSPANHPLDLANVEGVSYSSSAAPVADAETTQLAALDFKGLGGFQPPPRRRYGNRRYNDSSHNPDGSNKYAFLGGVGLTLPAGNLHKYDTTSYGVQVGAGRNFSKNVSLIAQFDYDNFGLQGRTLANQNSLYGTAGQGLDGNSHIWSFTLNPTYNIAVSEGLGAYIVGGVGFYHKVTNFTLPASGQYCDYYGYCYQYSANQNVDHYTSNAPGFNGGFGLTFKPSRFANERFYVEARYVYVLNSQKQGLTVANANTTFGLNYNGTNFYPANSNRSSYIPIKVGIRF